MLKRRQFLTAAVIVPSAITIAFPALAASNAPLIKATLIRSPGCSGCGAYARYLDQNGFDVTLDSSTDLSAVNQRLAIPEAVAGCPAMQLQKGYVVSGLIPVVAIRKLLAEHPDIRGITLRGMPPGAPGMTGDKIGSLTILAIRKDGTSYVFDTV